MARLRREDEHDRDVTQAWHTVRIGLETWNKKRLPELSRQFLRKGGPKKAQTLDQQRAVLHVLSAQWGIPLRKAKGKKKR